MRGLAVGASGLGAFDYSGSIGIADRNLCRHRSEPLGIATGAAHERPKLPLDVDVLDPLRLRCPVGAVRRARLDHFVVPTQRTHALADVFHARERIAAAKGVLLAEIYRRIMGGKVGIYGDFSEQVLHQCYTDFHADRQAPHQHHAE